jgi:hypothetical protein
MDVGSPGARYRAVVVLGMAFRPSLAVAWLTLLGCSAGSSDNGNSAGSAAEGGFSASGGSSGETGGQGGGFLTTGGGGEGGAAEEIAEVFGHTASELYRLDPETKAVSLVNTFSGCNTVIDIALDKDSTLVATSVDGVYEVDKLTAACTLIQTGDYPNSLSFIPAGTLDPNVEALVGYRGDEYVRIDPQTGSIQSIGYLGGNGLLSSGDVVSVKGGSSYLTVTGIDCPSDCLVEINPSTGAMITNWGPLGYSAVYGIAFWAGSVYGFDAAGNLFEVTFTGGVMTTTLIEQTGTSFYGAGSTTSAPPVPVPN